MRWPHRQQMIQPSSQHQQQHKRTSQRHCQRLGLSTLCSLCRRAGSALCWIAATACVLFAACVSSGWQLMRSERAWPLNC